MARPLVVGMTGPFQSGKTELRPVIEAAGWRFVNLNTVKNMLRLPGSERYNAYNQHIPGCLDDEGRETDAYYRHMTPEIRAALQPAEFDEVAGELRRLVRKFRPNTKALVSWEYWPDIVRLAPVDHMLVLCQARERWYERLRQRVMDRGWYDWTPDDDEIERITRVLDADPDRTLRMIQDMMPTSYTVIDVSPDDWGAPELLRVLESLAQSH